MFQVKSNAYCQRTICSVPKRRSMQLLPHNKQALMPRRYLASNDHRNIGRAFLSSLCGLLTMLAFGIDGRTNNRTAGEKLFKGRHHKATCARTHGKAISSLSSQSTLIKKLAGLSLSLIIHRFSALDRNSILRTAAAAHNYFRLITFTVKRVK